MSSGWFKDNSVWFYGISNYVCYLTQNKVYTYILNICIYYQHIFLITIFNEPDLFFFFLLTVKCFQVLQRNSNNLNQSFDGTHLNRFEKKQSVEFLTWKKKVDFQSWAGAARWLGWKLKM